MKGVLIGLMVLVLTLTGLAQGKYDANWCFGVKAGIDFGDTSTPRNFTTLANNYNGAASISDSAGNLLFYFAPDTPFSANSGFRGNCAIYGSDNKILLNGDSIDAGMRLVGCVFLNVPKNPNQYLLFYLKGVDSAQFFYANLYCCRISKSSNGEFTVIEKSKKLSTLPFEVNLAAARHRNGDDWWLILHGGNNSTPSNSYYTFLVSGDTIIGPFTQAIGTTHSMLHTVSSELSFSKSGQWFVNTLMEQNAADLFHFDRCNGLLSNFIPLTNIDATWINAEIFGCEFSASGKKLYLSEGDGGVFSTGRNGIYQYSLDAQDINASKKIIWQDSSFAHMLFGDLRRAPNNKIYLGRLGRPGAPYPANSYTQYNQTLGVINEPDSIGTACDFEPYGYYLGDSARTYYALPNMPNYNLGPASVFAASTGNDTVVCSDSANGAAIGTPAVPNIVYQWSPGRGLSDSTVAQPLAHPTEDTYYVLTVTDTSQSGNSCTSRTDTVFVRVEKCDTVGIGEIDKLSVKVYPNPANDNLTIEIPNYSSHVTFELYNVLGQVCTQDLLRGKQTSIDVSHLLNGIYLYHLTTDKKVSSGKVIIHR